jgi:hypothetical protein
MLWQFRKFCKRFKHKVSPAYSHPKRAKAARLGAPVLAR